MTQAQITVKDWVSTMVHNIKDFNQCHWIVTLCNLYNEYQSEFSKQALPSLSPIPKYDAVILWSLIEEIGSGP